MLYSAKATRQLFSRQRALCRVCALGKQFVVCCLTLDKQFLKEIKKNKAVTGLQHRRCPGTHRCRHSALIVASSAATIQAVVAASEPAHHDVGILLSCRSPRSRPGHRRRWVTLPAWASRSRRCEEEEKAPLARGSSSPEPPLDRPLPRVCRTRHGMELHGSGCRHAVPPHWGRATPAAPAMLVTMK